MGQWRSPCEWTVLAQGSQNRVSAGPTHECKKCVTFLGQTYFATVICCYCCCCCCSCRRVSDGLVDVCPVWEGAHTSCFRDAVITNIIMFVITIFRLTVVVVCIPRKQLVWAPILCLTARRNWKWVYEPLSKRWLCACRWSNCGAFSTSDRQTST